MAPSPVLRIGRKRHLGQLHRGDPEGISKRTRSSGRQLKLGQLKYHGSICAYLTEFRSLNNFARATGKALREKVDLAMPDVVLDMRFAHYLQDFADDEGFLLATHQVGLQVEKKKALKQAREQMKGTSSSGTSGRHDEQKKEGQDKRNPNSNKRGKETDKPRQERTESRTDKRPWWVGSNHWASKDEAMKGVPAKEQEEYGQRRDDCWR